MKNNESPILSPQQRQNDQLRWVETATRWMDSRFRIPGTNIRFGADFLLGLIPFAGDAISVAMSGVLVATMARNGASGRLVARMLTNVAIDGIIGAIPLVGDLFDLGFKANRRNLRLMREYYDEGKHQGSAWPIIIVVAVVVLLLIGLLIWGILEFFSWVFNAAF